MKKIFLVLAGLLLTSCAPLKPDGSFGSEVFVGRFHGIEVYKVTTPEGVSLYLGVDPRSGVLSVSNPQGKTRINTVAPIKWGP